MCPWLLKVFSNCSCVLLPLWKWLVFKQFIFLSGKVISTSGTIFPARPIRRQTNTKHATFPALSFFRRRTGRAGFLSKGPERFNPDYKDPFSWWKQKQSCFAWICAWKNGPRSFYDPLPTNDRFKPNLLSFLYFWSPCSAAREHFSNLDYLVKLAASFTFLAVVWTVSEGWQLWFKTNAVQTPLAQSTQKHFFFKFLSCAVRSWNLHFLLRA